MLSSTFSLSLSPVENVKKRVKLGGGAWDIESWISNADVMMSTKNDWFSKSKNFALRGMKKV
jgi:hypothetical protein